MWADLDHSWIPPNRATSAPQMPQKQRHLVIRDTGSLRYAFSWLRFVNSPRPASHAAIGGTACAVVVAAPGARRHSSCEVAVADRSPHPSAPPRPSPRPGSPHPPARSGSAGSSGTTRAWRNELNSGIRWVSMGSRYPAQCAIGHQPSAARSPAHRTSPGGGCR